MQSAHKLAEEAYKQSSANQQAQQGDAAAQAEAGQEQPEKKDKGDDVVDAEVVDDK